MLKGSVYIAVPDASRHAGHRVERRLVALERLQAEPDGGVRLRGEHVEVRNAGQIHAAGANGEAVASRLGDLVASPGDELTFEPSRGGERLYKVEIAEEGARSSYVAASRFGEVNAYFHLDRIAAYVAGLLHELGGPPLPRLVAWVTAHGVGERDPVTGLRDGVGEGSRWKPFEGGHYRLPSNRDDLYGCRASAPGGEIHLGPGWRRSEHGELARFAGKKYLFNASHDAGTLYHEFGHHISRHTADFRANQLRDPARQDNRKTAMDEGASDYWAATMLGTPHIHGWHAQHDERDIHPRSLASRRTMEHFDANPHAAAHVNGTIWGAALWDIRTALERERAGGVRVADLLALKSLLAIGTLSALNVRALRELREPFDVGAAALLRADAELFGSAHRDLLLAALGRRGIRPSRWQGLAAQAARVAAPAPWQGHTPALGWSRHVAPEDVPSDEDIMSAVELQRELDSDPEFTPTVLAAGDVMFGGRTRHAIAQFGDDYPLAAVRPLLDRAPIAVANLEGPLSRIAKRERRNYSYRMDTRFAAVLRRNGFSVVALANNHLTDCRRTGVMETLEALRVAGVAPIGAGLNQRAARAPAILTASGLRIGFLGYYWNTRTSATQTLPGSALDPPEALEEDISALRDQVDRIVVTFHWGIPYVREVSPADQSKARLAIDLGANAVIGHHPHVLQQFEVYKSRPIFYSVGNFAFGSGNSQAECIFVALTFEAHATRVRVYPAYVKNRDPRVNYQPKVLRGAGANHILQRLASLSGEHAALLRVVSGRGFVDLPRDGASRFAPAATAQTRQRTDVPVLIGETVASGAHAS